MSVRSGQSVTVMFTTTVAATGTPTGTLYVNGVANAAAVTVASPATAVYSAQVTLPTLAFGDMVDLVINATVASINSNSVVWSDTKDVAIDAVGAVTLADNVFHGGSGSAIFRMGSVQLGQTFINATGQLSPGLTIRGDTAQPALWLVGAGGGPCVQLGDGSASETGVFINLGNTSTAVGVLVGDASTAYNVQVGDGSIFYNAGGGANTQGLLWTMGAGSVGVALSTPTSSISAASDGQEGLVIVGATTGVRVQATAGDAVYLYAPAGVALNLPGSVGMDGAGFGASMLQSLFLVDSGLVNANAVPGSVVREVGIDVLLDLALPVPTTNAGNTLGDCLNAARAQGFGKWVIDPLGLTLKLYDPTGTIIVRQFALDQMPGALTRT